MAHVMPLDDAKQQFLDALAQTGVIGAAIAQVPAVSRGAATISRAAVSNWRKNDPAFEAAYQDALEASADALETEARRRAFEGVLREKCIGSGENARFIEEYVYSDTLLLALLKGNRPDKFAERTKSEISGPGGNAIEMNDTSAAARIAAILDNAKARRDGVEPEPEIDPFD